MSKGGAYVSMRGAHGGSGPGPRLRRAEPRGEPAWLVQADRSLGDAVSRVRMIAASTPANFRTELTRLVDSWQRGVRQRPQFAYAAPPDHRELATALRRLADALGREGPIAELYAGRARELADEATVASAAGTPGFWPAARQRFARRDRFDGEADALADRWLESNDDRRDEGKSAETVRSDDSADPRSLASRLRQELGARRLPLRVLVSRDLASLAATGDGALHVVAGRWLSHRDVERTVLHEIEGHVLPRLAASGAPLGIFALGTARGSDDQEGRALWLERAAGFLDRGRRRELALRHVAARSVERGEDFLETAARLAVHEERAEALLRVACRAHRGGGLAREAVYLPALLRTEAASHDPGVEATMRLGRVAVDAVPALRAWMGRLAAAG